MVCLSTMTLLLFPRRLETDLIDLIRSATGNPHNQLAVLASSFDPLENAYRCFRSGTTRSPFASANENTKALFLKNAALASSLLSQRISDLSVPVKVFLHSSLFTLYSLLFTRHSSLFILHSSLFTLQSRFRFGLIIWRSDKIKHFRLRLRTRLRLTDTNLFKMETQRMAHKTGLSLLKMLLKVWRIVEDRHSQ